MHYYACQPYRILLDTSNRSLVMRYILIIHQKLHVAAAVQQAANV